MKTIDLAKLQDAALTRSFGAVLEGGTPSMPAEGSDLRFTARFGAAGDKGSLPFTPR